jgi:hypothetical protein
MTEKPPTKKNPASFRDPDGFVFTRNGALFRQVNESYRENYGLLMRSGLYARLVRDGSLIPHEEAVAETDLEKPGFLLKPEPIPFISYPYEWCFSQLQDAALKTLEVQLAALDCGMTLKDASAYNIQFRDAKPIHIDTLSFEAYEEGRPWQAYGQFCRHFLAPLALMAHRDARLNSMARDYVDGIPLDLAASLLPRKTLLHPGLAMHLHLHARSQRAYSGKAKSAEGLKLGKRGLIGILQSLQGTVKKLAWKNRGTEWGDYYRDTNYAEAALEAKKALVGGMLKRAHPASCWDLGSNNGLFSRIASGMGIRTLAFDIDHGAVEAGYRAVRAQGEKNILNLIADLSNPSPALGWSHRERASLLDRGPADACMALALIHHLAISNNLPFPELADFFARACRFLIIEFVPKQDSQVQRLLASRKDIFTGYDETAFAAAFSARFAILERHPIPDSARTLYLMERLDG